MQVVGTLWWGHLEPTQYNTIPTSLSLYLNMSSQEGSISSSLAAANGVRILTVPPPLYGNLRFQKLSKEANNSNKQI
ncbi:hypothetical protein C1H46_030254 [Malus baccata]|uniref:Uncharacterized protein n=1 Tax=Malus baccata TaxID=106549 RepID=A0A540LCF8_MALBA|nr:hypothetical protein C1H46_030254 [Malus baccata]